MAKKREISSRKSNLIIRIYCYSTVTFESAVQGNQEKAKDKRYRSIQIVKDPQAWEDDLTVNSVGADRYGDPKERAMDSELETRRAMEEVRALQEKVKRLEEENAKLTLSEEDYKMNGGTEAPTGGGIPRREPLNIEGRGTDWNAGAEGDLKGGKTRTLVLRGEGSRNRTSRT